MLNYFCSISFNVRDTLILYTIYVWLLLKYKRSLNIKRIRQLSQMQFKKCCYIKWLRIYLNGPLNSNFSISEWLLLNIFLSLCYFPFMLSLYIISKYNSTCFYYCFSIIATLWRIFLYFINQYVSTHMMDFQL